MENSYKPKKKVYEIMFFFLSPFPLTLEYLHNTF